MVSAVSLLKKIQLFIGQVNNVIANGLVSI